MSITLNATEEELRRAIRLDLDSCSNDNEFCDGTRGTGILSIKLLDTRLLCDLVDRDRYARGEKPMFPFDDLTDDDCDPDIWYEFYINCDADETGYLDAYINVFCMGGSSCGDCFECEIFLPDPVRQIVYEILDRQVYAEYCKHIEDALFEDREADPAL